MPVPDIFPIAPDFTVCEYCNKSYADTKENIHRICVEKKGLKRVFFACVHCIKKAKEDSDYDEYMTNKTFNEGLGRLVNHVLTVDNFKIVGYGNPRSDETSNYIIETYSFATVKGVINTILRKKEQGHIGIKDKNEPFFGAHAFEYSYEEMNVKTHEEEYFWKSIFDKKVTAIEGSGGWGQSDYQLVLGE